MIVPERFVFPETERVFAVTSVAETEELVMVPVSKDELVSLVRLIESSF